MSTVYLELVENFLSSELRVGFDAQAVGALDDLTEEQLELFRYQWSEVDRGQHQYMVQSLPLRRGPDTAAPVNADKVADATAVVRPTSALFTHPYNGLSALDLDLVKRQALFFSQVTVIAPRP